MKIPYVSLLILLVPLIGFTQTPTLLCNSWNSAEHDCSFSPEHTDTTSLTCFLRITSDTIINSFQYYKLEESYDTTMVQWDDLGFIKFSPDGGINFRELDGDEYLLYTFAINKYDTVFLWGYDYFPQLSAYVYEKDSILIGDEYKNRLFINYLESGKEEIWVEGLGSLSGFIRYPEDHLIGSYMKRELLCCHKDTNLIYQNPDYENCIHYHQNTSGDNSNYAQNRFIIFPNPCISTITVTSKTWIVNTDYHLFDVSGRCVQTGNIPQCGYTFTIPLLDLPGGIYFLKFDESNQTLKLIKE